MVLSIFLFLCRLGSMSELFGVKFICFLLKLDVNMLMVLLFKFKFLFVLNLLVLFDLLGLIRWCSIGWIMKMISIIIIKLLIISLRIGRNLGCF